MKTDDNGANGPGTAADETTWAAQGRALGEFLGAAPVGMAFCQEPPAGVARVGRPAASGCTYWKLAEQGQVFYTEAADHFGCAVGAYTHGVDLPPAQQHELGGLLSTMQELSYLRAEEVPGIPRRQAPLRYAVYGPLARLPVPPEVVLVHGTPRQLMILEEAGKLAGCADSIPVMTRPTCAMVPQMLSATQTTTTTSLGCIGNRVYTDLPDDRAYFGIPYPALAGFVKRLAIIIKGNEALRAFHLDRKRAAAVPA